MENESIWHPSKSLTQFLAGRGIELSIFLTRCGLNHPRDLLINKCRHNNASTFRFRHAFIFRHTPEGKDYWRDVERDWIDYIGTDRHRFNIRALEDVDLYANEYKPNENQESYKDQNVIEKSFSKSKSIYHLGEI